MSVTTLPIVDRSGAAQTAGTPIPVGFKSATITVNCTTGDAAAPFTGFAHPFSDPAMQLEFFREFSFDGGLTFPDGASNTVAGQPTGIWAVTKNGTQIMAPNFTFELPELPSPQPTHFLAGYRATGGPITFGLTIVTS